MPFNYWLPLPTLAFLLSPFFSEISFDFCKHTFRSIKSISIISLPHCYNGTIIIEAIAPSISFIGNEFWFVVRVSVRCLSCNIKLLGSYNKTYKLENFSLLSSTITFLFIFHILFSYNHHKSLLKKYKKVQ